MNGLNAPPVELASDGFSAGGGYSDEEELPLTTSESLHDFILYNDEATASFSMKVRLYSLDVEHSHLGYCSEVTISIGGVGMEPCADIVTNNFKELVLRTKSFSVTMHRDKIKRISYTEEDNKTCSLILAVGLPSIVKLEMGE